MKAFIIVLSLVYSSIAFSFRTIFPVNSGHIYKSPEIEVFLDIKSCQGLNLSSGEFKSIIDNVLEKTWNAHPDKTALHLKFRGEVELGFEKLTSVELLYQKANPLPNGTILIGCGDERFHKDMKRSSIQAKGGLRCEPIGEDDFDCRGVVAINKNALLSYGILTELGKSYFDYKIAHEIGHALNLDHSDDPTAFMGFGYGQSNLFLMPDDVEALSILYPLEFDNSSSNRCQVTFGMPKVTWHLLENLLATSKSLEGYFDETADRER